jgi:hypothetical protein
MAVLSSTQKTAALLWWLHVKSNDVGGLALEFAVVGGHVALDAMGLSPARCHARATIMWLTPLAACGKRVFGPPSIEATAHYDTIRRRPARGTSRILASSAGVRFSTARPGWRVYGPAQPLSLKRFFQRLM